MQAIPFLPCKRNRAPKKINAVHLSQVHYDAKFSISAELIGFKIIGEENNYGQITNFFLITPLIFLLMLSWPNKDLLELFARFLKLAEKPFWFKICFNSSYF